MASGAREDDSPKGRRKRGFDKKRSTLALNRAKLEVAFFTGREALQEVAKDDGLWNWALVGPDPKRLPLSGGGKGSIDEMRGAIGRHAHSFGLLRMTFGLEQKAKTKFMFIHASDPIDSGNFSAVERGKAMGMQPMMIEAIHQFARTAATVHIQSQEECTVENLVEKLRSVVLRTERDIVTVQNLNAAVEHHKEVHPDASSRARRTEIEQAVRPRPSTVIPENDVVLPTGNTADTLETDEGGRQRKKVKGFKKGDVVEVYSSKHKTWFEDAEIAEVVQESTTIGGYKVRAGSMKVVYDNGTRYKWVAPQQLDEFIRSSPRPRPPEPLVGDLQAEVNSWFSTYMQNYYFELNKGFLQWWDALDNARLGVAPQGSIYLLGLNLQEQDDAFVLRSEATEGAVYRLQAESEDVVEEWSEALWAHAGFCEEMREYHEAKLQSSEMRSQLLEVMSKKVSGTEGGA